MRCAHYVVLDTETTGLRAGRHGLTELYAARIDGHGNVVDEFHSLINPGHHIPSFITRLTGITDEMVRYAPLAKDVIAQFNDFLRPTDILVGHNVRFDLSFLDYARVHACGEPFCNPSLCTLLLARRLFAHRPLPSYKLGHLAAYFTIDAHGAHRAKKDVQMTIEVLKYFFTHLEQRSLTALDDLLSLQRLPLAKARCLFSED